MTRRLPPRPGVIVVERPGGYNRAATADAGVFPAPTGDAMPVYDAARANMVESQIRPNKVTDERVIAAFSQVRRELFVPPALAAVAYADDDLALGGGRFLMQPMVAARLLQAAMISRNDAILVVSAGTGYEATAAALIGRSVIALENDSGLARIGHAALVEHRIAAATFVEGPPRQGHRARAPYDVILFGGAVPEIPEDIKSQLGEGGRMVAVLRPGPGVGRATLFTRTGGIIAHRAIFDAGIPLLADFVTKPAFVF
ncbi:MAG TPA: protein-L-isoaspartate O-methyltransferase [Stellaceae bacterium]|nr:protein-L-isoaspartate O-methyltransferase [Stellaceae bacterium]